MVVKKNYEVNLDIFKGPLDLLLFLIRKDKLDIYDIPIAHITDQFFAHLQLMQDLDLNIAADFIEMAAILMRIKVQLLLPSHQNEEGVTEDPRDELIQQLIEYQKMKEAAEQLSQREVVHSQKFPRPQGLIPEKEVCADDAMWEASLFDLFNAFIQVSKQLELRSGEHYVEKKEVTIEEKMAIIINSLRHQNRLLFFDLFIAAENKVSIVVTFMALLELLRLRQISVRQTRMFGDIWIYRAADFPIEN